MSLCSVSRSDGQVAPRELDADTKLMISLMVGDRVGTTAYQLMSDLKTRITDRIQLTTDGFPLT
jgi:hypothetical protein